MEEIFTADTLTVKTKDGEKFTFALNKINVSFERDVDEYGHGIHLSDEKKITIDGDVLLMRAKF